MALTAERIARLREGTYTAAGKRVYFQDGQTMRDAADLYAILREQHGPTGSPNLENNIARAFVEQLQTGAALSEVQLAKLLELLKKYAPDLKTYRESPDRSQDILSVPDPSTAKILN